MKFTKAEREAWAMVADTLEVCGMPEYANGQLATGLCAVALIMARDGVISGETSGAMISRIRLAMISRIRGDHPGYLFPECQVRPRVALARKWAAGVA